MPQRNLELQEKQIRKQLRKNTFIATVCVAAGFSLLIPAFSVAGSRINQQEFCFMPKYLTNPEQHDFCTGNKIRWGIAWRVVMEASENNEFKSKVTLLDFLPAKNPNAGLYGLCSAGFFFSAFLMFKSGTNQLEDTLDIFVWNKRSLVIERAFENNQHIEIEQLKSHQGGEFVKDIMQRDHAEAMYSLMSDGERELAANQHHRGEQLDDAGFNLQLQQLKAQIAEQQEKEVKHKAEVAKLNKTDKASKSTTENISTDEAAKQELIAKLKTHENGWLYTLVVTNKPIFIIG